MSAEERRVLTDREKKDLLDKHQVCYICLEKFDGYSREEIQFDHIYNYVDQYSQDLSNFAPVHASKDNRKLNCHRDKGRKSPVEYREELRIKKSLEKVSGLKDLCSNALQSGYSISEDKGSIEINGEQLPLYNQRLSNIDNYYFFHEIDTQYIENDNEIQLRPLEPKIVALISNLKRYVQLLPCLGRLDPVTKTIKIFDGQHKAIAQIIGNGRKKIPCIIFVNPKVEDLRVVVYQAHTDFVQQRYKKSHIDAKLADIYHQKIETFRMKVGDPNAKYSEADILRGQSKADTTKFLRASIISEINLERGFIRDYAAQDRKEQRVRPILWQSIERIVSKFCKLDPLEKFSDDQDNYRSEEIENICFILDQIEEFAIRGKWDPKNSESKLHQLSRTYFYRTAFNNWINILEEAMRFGLEQMRGSKIYDALCYRETFSPEIKSRFISITKKLFDHPLWVQETIQQEISVTNVDAPVGEIFRTNGLDYIYLTKL